MKKNHKSTVITESEIEIKTETIITTKRIYTRNIKKKV